MHDILLGAGPLLTGGALAESGYSSEQIKKYDRSAVVRGANRLSETNSYCLGNESCFVCLSVTSKPHSTDITVSLLDFTHIRHITKRKRISGRTPMPPSCSAGDVKVAAKGAEISFAVQNGEHAIACRLDRFDGSKTLEFEFKLKADRCTPTVALPLKRNGFFYGTRLMLCGSGKISLGEKTMSVGNGCGSLEWVRAIPEKPISRHTAALVCNVDGLLGITLGNGLSGTGATENAIVYNGKLTKLGEVKFAIPFTDGAIDYLKPWKITDEEDKLSLLFYPLVDRQIKRRTARSEAHRIFGVYYGKAVLDGGTIVTVKDKIGYAEHIRNGM